MRRSNLGCRCPRAPRAGRAPKGHRSFETPEAVVAELVLWADNDGKLYPMKRAIRANLLRKMKAGKYNSALAVKAWRYFADAGAKSYGFEFDARTPGARTYHAQKGYGGFSVEDRNGAAKKWRCEFENDVRMWNGWKGAAAGYGLEGERGLR